MDFYSHVQTSLAELCRCHADTFPLYFSSPRKRKGTDCLVLPAPSVFPTTTSGRTFCCADDGSVSMDQMIEFPFLAARAGCKLSELLKAFPHRLSWTKDYFKLRQLKNKWLIWEFISHVVCVIYFHSLWLSTRHVHHPFLGICSYTCALEIAVSHIQKIDAWAQANLFSC